MLIGAGPAVREKHVNEKMLRYVQKKQICDIMWCFSFLFFPEKNTSPFLSFFLKVEFIFFREVEAEFLLI